MKSLFILVLFYSQSLVAQEIHFLRTLYSDDFREWLLYDDENKDIGNLRTRYQLTPDYSQWDIRLGELSGSVQLRWKDKPNEWEVRLQNEFLTASPTWPGQLDSWRITDHSKTYYLSLKQDPEGIQWILSKDQNDLLYVYNVYYNDVRDWAVEYQKKEVSTSLIITAIFLSSYYSTPK